ncbi:hypothetical protein MIR68_005245 [Amoeboaphelidium protococcarum]|nr:hypothetical protein MIR68_005245 [Amoeboaphelidium protococcarum]
MELVQESDRNVNGGMDQQLLHAKTQASDIQSSQQLVLKSSTIAVVNNAEQSIQQQQQQQVHSQILQKRKVSQMKARKSAPEKFDQQKLALSSRVDNGSKLSPTPESPQSPSQKPLSRRGHKKLKSGDRRRIRESLKESQKKLLNQGGPASFVLGPPVHSQQRKSSLSYRKSLSMNDLQREHSVLFSTDLLTDISATTQSRNQKGLAQSDVKRQEKAQAAAITIQRYYRFYRMKRHYGLMLDKMQQSRNLSLIKESRRKSVMLMLAHANQISPSQELLLRFQLESQTSPSSETQIQLDTQTSMLQSNEMLDAQKEKKAIRKVTNLFNENPSKGIQSAIQIAQCGPDSKDVAKFLLTHPGLSKIKIGEYLGIGDSISNQVLHHFVDELDFQNLSFDDALRMLLQTFRLPGEAQKIDRIMNEFARKFCQDNSDVFQSPDTAYILAFSLIMLNTDAHNPNVKKKMSVTDFLRNNRGINNKEDLPRPFMEQLYYNIINNEIKMNDHDGEWHFRDILSKLEGKQDALQTAGREVLAEFTAYQIPDIGKPNTHRHERTLFVCNDLLLIVKPRHGMQLSQYVTMQSDSLASISRSNLQRNVAELKEREQQYSVRERVSSASGTVSSRPSSAAAGGRYQFRYFFNYITMSALSKSSACHPFIVQLVNINGHLIDLGFSHKEEQERFLEVLRAQIEDEEERELDKKRKLSELTISRAEAAKFMIEKTYSLKDLSYDELSHSQSSITDESAGQGQLAPRHRFSQYGSLRDARTALKAQAAFLRGKSSKKTAQEAKAVEQIQTDLKAFSVQYKLSVPSPSPQNANHPANDALIEADELSPPLQSSNDNLAKGDGRLRIRRKTITDLSTLGN